MPKRQDRTKEGRGPVPGKVPGFILTASTQASPAEAAANKALLLRCLQQDGFIRMRLPVTVYDPVRKQYVHLRGESLNLNLFGLDALDNVLAGIRNGLLKGEHDEP